MILRTRNTIAGAVCRATLRTEADPGYLIAEPAAYKCALAERGSNPLQLCADATRDYDVVLNRLTSPRTREEIDDSGQLCLALSPVPNR
jgi:hypothetical protein